MVGQPLDVNRNALIDRKQAKILNMNEESILECCITSYLTIITLYLDNTGPPCKHEHQADKRGGSGEARSFSSTYTRSDRAIGYCH